MEYETLVQSPETIPAVSQTRQSTGWSVRDIHFDCTLDLGEAGSVSVPANLLLPYVWQAIKLMRHGEVLRLTSGPGTLVSAS